MKCVFEATLVAALIAGGFAKQHNHHHHAKRHNHSPEEKRALDTVTQTKYEYILDNHTIDNKDAEDGIARGVYIIVGEATATSSTSTSASPASTALSSQQAAQFFEQKSSSAPPPRPTPSAASAPAPAAAPASIDTDFPSGQLDCGALPDAYGATNIGWNNVGGWAGLQVPDSYIPGVAINSIMAPISGTCGKGMFCSYGCVPGYQKTQWPENSQGAAGQSVGGLWCNSNGKLELTRPSHTKICAPGAGNVFIQNNLPGSAAVCRTDYPGSEAMVIPLDTQPGQKYPLTNPIAKDYYVWQGKPTTAQYYVNPMDVSVEDACVWTSPTNPASAGNWAPVNIGTGLADDGNTYIGLFPNAPTSTAQLNFNIEITGDVNGECWLRNGLYPGGSATGCTATITGGTGVAIIVFSK